MSSFDLENLANSAAPPRYLFKYLSVGRIGNVLEQGKVRFTGLLNTNDSFEIRSTFRKLAGPRFRKMLAEQMDSMLSETSVEAIIAEQLQILGLESFSPKLAMQMLEARQGGNFIQTLRKQIQDAVDGVMLPHLNDPENAEKVLEKLGSELLCFSLSERFDSAPMWAHYADNHQGFVIAFDTSHEWFKQRNDGKKTRIQKVTYFDGMVEEPLENVSAAFISKTTDWAYEHEWRLYAKLDQVDATVGTPSDPIHLLNFPKDIVDRVIVGSKAKAETIEKIRSILTTKYTLARLTRASPNKETHTFDEVDI